MSWRRSSTAAATFLMGNGAFWLQSLAMASYRYLHLDVFTDRRFEGNQLAVFPEPEGLTTEMMQTIAREMNFSESTFIFPPERGGDVRMRIFTPGAELPMAGHPTIGSTFALALEGVIARGRPDFVFELGIGPTPVSLEWSPNGLSFAWMQQGLPQFGGTVDDRPGLAAALGIEPADLAARLPAQLVSCGLPFLFVPIAAKAAVDTVAIDRKALLHACRNAGLPELPVFVFAVTSSERATASVYSRMLAPAFGVAEDPATGGASGPLGCYLLHHGVVGSEAARAILSLQGVAMGRPSRIHVSIGSDDHRITHVRVGGTSVLVGKGEVNV